MNFNRYERLPTNCKKMTKKKHRRKGLTLHSLLLCAFSVISVAQAEKPNVVFIAIDDMNDWVNCLGGYPGKVHTPNIDALAKKGMLFTQAYCSSPMCNPSRVALWTGKRPSTTGVYGQYSQWDDNRTENKTLFLVNGFYVGAELKLNNHDLFHNMLHVTISEKIIALRNPENPVFWVQEEM